MREDYTNSVLSRAQMYLVRQMANVSSMDGVAKLSRDIWGKARDAGGLREALDNVDAAQREGYRGSILKLFRGKAADGFFAEPVTPKVELAPQPA